MKRTAKTFVGLASVVALVCVGVACSSSDTSPAKNTGGSAGAGGSAGTGGAAGSTGGAAGTGGSSGTGGAAGTGGDTTQGGAAGTGGSAGTGGDTTQGGSSGTGGTTVGACSPATVTIPFNVTDKYGIAAAFGVWGNNQSVKISACTTRAPGTPAGKCNTIAYTYDPAVGSDCTGAPQDAGVSCNWTAVVWHVAAPGLCIAAGATKITFQAWGTGTVEFQPFTDSGIKVSQLLTTTPTQYSIDISTSGYAAKAQEAGFIVAFTSTNTPATVNVDDIKWVQ
jgi:hypothetical protein